MPRTNVLGVITAGTFYHGGKRVFWDVHHPEKTIVIDLHNERYNELVVALQPRPGTRANHLSVDVELGLKLSLPLVA